MKRLCLALAFAVSLTSFLSPANAVIRGSANEAVTMVERVVALYESKGFDSTKQAIMDKSNGNFHDRDLYVFIYDLNGVNVAHGVKPQLVGKNLSALRDQDGVMLIAEMIKIVRAQGSGWVDYKWPNPTNNKVENKSAYVVKLGDDYFAGVGIYK